MRSVSYAGIPTPDGATEGIMTTTTDYSLRPIGFVRSRIISRKDAPNKPPKARPTPGWTWTPLSLEGLEDIAPGQEVILLTWLHQGAAQHPQGPPPAANPRILCGAYLLRARPTAPTPSASTVFALLEIADSVRLRVEPLEVINGTPVLDIKPV